MKRYNSRLDQSIEDYLAEQKDVGAIVRNAFLVLCVAAMVIGWICSGCTSTPTPRTPEPSDLIAAKTLVWNFYGHTDAPPLVEVISQAQLTCRNSPCPEKGQAPGSPECPWFGFGARGIQTNYSCNAGIEGAINYLTVVRRSTEPWHLTALAHEELHSDEALHGVIDLGHMGKDWKPGGRLDQANALIDGKGY